MTASAALVVAGHCDNWREGAEVSAAAIDQGKAMGVLASLRELTPHHP